MRHLILRTFTGPFALIETDDGSLRTSWMDDAVERELRASTLDRKLHPSIVNRLHRYFDGEIVDFDDIATPHGAGFQRRCWQACRRIPRGETRTYADLARAAKSPTAFRAAGQSMRQNLLPIIIPCHRVVATGGSLHGFAGSVDAHGRELNAKRALLQMEGALADEAVLSGLSGSPTMDGKTTRGRIGKRTAARVMA